MRIIADENIPYVAEAFERLGSVKTLPGRKMTPDVLAGADALLVRSITPVNEALLANTPVRFVGTATIGFDHVDTAYLHRQGIAFATAAGSNANSVAEYITAALLVLAERFDLCLEGKTLGVVGYGNVGTKVVRHASHVLGMNVLISDPPLQRQGVPVGFVELDQLLAESDAVTFHVPLTRDGPDRTHRLIDAAHLAKMKPGAILLNTARGSVVVGPDLKAALAAGRLRAAVLDVWEDEPHIDPDLLRRVALATPHIAGYSFDGKVAGTQMLFDALCRHYKITDKFVNWTQLVPPAVDPVIPFRPTSDDQADLRQLLRRIYDIEADDARLRQLAALPADQQGPYFDKLRKEYPVRREAWNYTVQLPPDAGPLLAKLESLRFNVGNSG
jgi:erythronate-4-phosphate dehydrogenase